MEVNNIKAYFNMLTFLLIQFKPTATKNSSCRRYLDTLPYTIREHLRTHDTFIVDQIIRDFLHGYHKFSIKSYVVAIY